MARSQRGPDRGDMVVPAVPGRSRHCAGRRTLLPWALLRPQGPGHRTLGRAWRDPRRPCRGPGAHPTTSASSCLRPTMRSGAHPRFPGQLRPCTRPACSPASSLMRSRKCSPGSGAHCSRPRRLGFPAAARAPTGPTRASTWPRWPISWPSSSIVTRSSSWRGGAASATRYLGRLREFRGLAVANPAKPLPPPARRRALVGMPGRVLEGRARAGVTYRSGPAPLTLLVPSCASCPRGP